MNILPLFPCEKQGKSFVNFFLLNSNKKRENEMIFYGRIFPHVFKLMLYL